MCTEGMGGLITSWQPRSKKIGRKDLGTSYVTPSPHFPPWVLMRAHSAMNLSTYEHMVEASSVPLVEDQAFNTQTPLGGTSYLSHDTSQAPKNHVHSNYTRVPEVSLVPTVLKSPRSKSSL